MASCIIDWSHSLGQAVDLPKQGGPTERAAKLLLRGQKIVDWRCFLRRRMSPLVAPNRRPIRFARSVVGWKADSARTCQIGSDRPDSDIVRLPSAQIVRHWQRTPEIGRRLAVPGLWSPRNHLNREDGNESSALSSIRSVMPQSDQAARRDGPDRGQTKFR